MPSILDKIVSSKRQRIAEAKSRHPPNLLKSQLGSAPPVRDFFGALSGGESIRLIAEVKKASPSQGVIRKDFDPAEIARAYERAGAHCLSVLTDVDYFLGDLEHLRSIRESVSLPLLRKDFVLDVYQVWEARLAGADAVLLIAECLNDCLLRSLYRETLDLGMTPLVEMYDTENCSRILDLGSTLVGVNNRDLRTFEVDLHHTIQIRKQIPEDCILVSESGICRREDVQLLESSGVDAMLVGEHFMRQPDVGRAVRDLLGLG
jgi:indole-3-glycerol phosphate synthase